MGYGDRIKYHRIRCKLTQADIGKVCGVSAQAISKWELNKAEPDSQSIRKMCELFGIDANELIDISSNESESTFTETLYRRPGMRILFDAAKDAPDEVLQRTADLLEALKNGQKR